MDKEFYIETIYKNAKKGLEPHDEGRPKTPAVMPVQNVERSTFHLSDAVQMKRTARLRALLDFNNMTSPIVSGILSENVISDKSKVIPFQSTPAITDG